MRSLISGLFCFFIVIQGPWLFVPCETLEDFLKKNTPMEDQEISETLKIWYNIAETQGDVEISHRAFLKANTSYLKRKAEQKLINQNLKQLKLEDKINNLLDDLQKKNVPR